MKKKNSTLKVYTYSRFPINIFIIFIVAIENPVAIAAPKIPNLGIKMALKIIFMIAIEVLFFKSSLSCPHILKIEPFAPTMAFIICPKAKIIKALEPMM